MANLPKGSPAIAVVDDDPSVLESLEPFLASAGYAVRVFASAEALLGVGPSGFDCLICDIDLPGIDGFELVRRVRAAKPALPVVLITGHQEMQDRSASIGPVQLFKKPFDPDKLLAAVDDAVRGSQRPPSP